MFTYVLRRIPLNFNRRFKNQPNKEKTAKMCQMVCDIGLLIQVKGEGELDEGLIASVAF